MTDYVRIYTSGNSEPPASPKTSGYAFRIHVSRMQRTNVAVLTQSHAAIAAKKRKKNGQVKEVIFDDDARR